MHEKRQHENATIVARWAGLFAQVNPKSHDKLLKQILADKPVKRMMGGKEIGLAMRAWALRTAA